MMRLEISRNTNLGGGTGNGYCYTLAMPGKDGEDEQRLDVTPALTSLHLRMGVKEVNSAQITFRLDDVDIKADALVALQTFMEEREEANQEIEEITTAADTTRKFRDSQ